MSAEENRKACLKAAREWNDLADAVESMGMWDRLQGIDLSPPGAGPSDHKARVYRQCARSLVLEAETGMPHCTCHLCLLKDCPATRKLVNR
jgi:hypothetical protein